MRDELWNLPVVKENKAIVSPIQSNAPVKKVFIPILSADKIARSLKKDDDVSVMLLEQLSGDLNFTHRAEHSDSINTKISSSEEMLGKLEKDFPKVFEPPTYPIINDRILFTMLLIDSAKPAAHCKLYPLSQVESDEPKKQLTDLLDSGRIVPMASPYGHLTLFAQKMGGDGLGLCMDYRSLNANTITNVRPLSRIDELLSRLRGSTVFSRLDLCNGYHQIPIAEHEQFKTVFSYRYGNFQCIFMPFRLKNAPAHFQRTMNMTFRDMLDTCILVYLDNILIFSKSHAEHELYIRQVFERLQQCNFHIKHNKCEIFLESIEFLGQQVSTKGIEVTQDKVEAVASWSVPQNVHHIWQFLGLCNHFRWFIPKFSKVV